MDFITILGLKNVVNGGMSEYEGGYKMAKKELFKVDKCYYTDSLDYGKYILKCSIREIAKFDNEPTEEQIQVTIQAWKDNSLNDTITIRERLCEDEIIVNISDIKEFGINNHKTWTAKGKFKTWWKRFYVTTKEGNFYWMHESDFHILKEILDGKYSKEKYTISEYKNYSERKATDWIFKMIV